MAILTPVASTRGAGRPGTPAEGFIPLVAIAVSDDRTEDDFDWEHKLRNFYQGNPLAGSPETNYAIGILDTGAAGDLIGKANSGPLGVWDNHMSGNFTQIAGAGGTIDIPISQPMGVFAQGVGAIGENGRLDLNSLVGHGNVVSMVIPPDDDEFPGVTSSLIGIPFLAFYNTIIRNDIRHEVELNGTMRTTPDVQIVDPFFFDPAILDDYSRGIPLEFGPIAATASYYGLNIGDPFNPSPQSPTLLSLIPVSIPSGGGFFANVNLGQGELSPTNPVREFRMLFDTGADVSIISRAAAANLNLDLRNPDFTIDVEAIGGNLEDVPGFYIDYARINASGGAMEWERVPFFVIDLLSPEGGALDGILGTNFFWNRNIVFEPTLIGSSFLYVSDPLYGPEVLAGDVDLDVDLDTDDIDALRAVRGGDFHTAPLAIFDLNVDAAVDEADVTYLVRDLMRTEVGDLDLDGRVDLSDFSGLKQHFGLAGGWGEGELNGDGLVDLSDFGLLKGSFGFESDGLRGLAVPEPSGLILASLSLFALAMIGRTRVFISWRRGERS